MGSHDCHCPDCAPASQRQPDSISLRLTSDPAYLAPVRRTLEEFCAAHGFDEAARGQIVLCVNEALTNVTRHAYAGALDQPVQLDVAFADAYLVVMIRDWGSGKLPDECMKPRDPLQTGGVGMVCLHKLMDQIEFVPQPDGMLLILQRKLREPRHG